MSPYPGTDFCPNCSETIAKIRNRNDRIARLRQTISELGVIAKRIDDSDRGKMMEVYPDKPYPERQALLRMDQRSLTTKVLEAAKAAQEIHET